MKILELEIENIRGIRHLELIPEGESISVFGPNGSGKSTVVDAVDFLLTGKIARLTGRGSGSLSLSRHGPHIDASPEDAVVRATITLPGRSEPIQISRCIANPGKLECDDEVRSELETTLERAARGQHVLTRKDILRYITAEPRDRAEAVQSVLNIGEVEQLRQRLVRVRGELRGSANQARADYEAQQARVATAAEEERFDLERVKERVNAHRGVLEGEPIDSMRGDLHRDLLPLGSRPRSDRLNPALVEQDINVVGRIMDPERLTTLRERDERFRDLIEGIRASAETRRSADRQRLINMGLELLDDGEDCPLCGRPWEAGELREKLEREAAEAQRVVDQLSEMDRTAQDLGETVRAAAASGTNLVEACALLFEEGLPETIADWVEQMEDIVQELSEPLDRYGRIERRVLSEVVDDGPSLDLLDRISERARATEPDISPEQTAWDSLTRIEQTLGTLFEVEQRVEREELAEARANALVESFQEARDQIVEELYDSIRDRFVSLYRALHSEDEGEFSASLTPEGAALDLTVDFYGTGEHPPHALHSEGHQDSMGICLFLALAEKLGEDMLDLIILDDVVMSVDADHRRHVAELLPQEFPNKQFLITTHDRTWSNQLRNSGGISNRVEFYDWSLGTGPYVQGDPDQWDEIERMLDDRDVAGAAARLRRSAEEFFSSACEAVEAQVPYRSDARWDLGVLMPKAVSRFRKWIREGKNVANQWGDEERVAALEEVDSVTAQIFERTRAEDWAVNPAIHYNEWENFTPNDFHPVVEAFRDMFDHLRCSRCGGLPRIANMGHTATTLSCPCADFSVNLSRPGR